MASSPETRGRAPANEPRSVSSISVCPRRDLAHQAWRFEFARQPTLEGEGAERRYRRIEHGPEDGQILGRQLDVEPGPTAALRVVEGSGHLGRQHIGIAGRGVEPFEPEAVADLGQPGHSSDRAQLRQRPVQRPAEERREIAIEGRAGPGRAEKEHVVDPAGHPDRPLRRSGAQIDRFEIEALAPAGQTAARLQGAELGQATVQSLRQRCGRRRPGVQPKIGTLNRQARPQPDVLDSSLGGDGQPVGAADPQIKVGQLQGLRGAAQGEAPVDRTELRQGAVQSLGKRRGRG